MKKTSQFIEWFYEKKLINYFLFVLYPRTKLLASIIIITEKIK